MGTFDADVKYYEFLELKGASSVAFFAGDCRCAVSVNAYGKGRAYYMATEPNRELFSWLLEKIAPQIGLSEPIRTPACVQARKIAPDQTFYVNQDSRSVELSLPEPGYGVLSGKQNISVLKLNGYDGELIITQKSFSKYERSKEAQI